MRTHRWLIISSMTVALIAASAGCSKSNDATTASTGAPSTASGSTPGTAPVTTPTVKTPGTTATTANGTAAPTTSGSTPAKANQVVIKDFLFTPNTLSVTAGKEVVWVNEDEFDHQVLADDKTSFDSNKLAQGKSYAHTFSTPGMYPYFCNIHNQMKGTIFVSEA